MESNFVKVGSLQRSFGVDGFLRYKLLSQFKEDFKGSTFVFLQHEDYYVPYRVKELRNEKRLIQFDDVSDQDKASLIHNMDMFLPSLEVTPKEDDQSDFLVGYMLYDDEVLVAEIAEVKTIAGYLYAVINYNEKEVLIPIHEDLMLELNPDERIIRMELPEGLLDL